ncbi:CPBP family glutamic-type intramembrane protease [Parasphingorhabdus sp. JC815]|uniref:CPBP family glutamic-type intramembrane protease n=1 Tax=Parasphingorhabdus sp. JC815 TaxID=3232140 RepID=UPI0034584A34
MQKIFQQTMAALKIWPERKQWSAALRVAIPALAIIAALGFLAEWLIWAPVTDVPALLTTAVILFFVPALVEEIVFRGVLLSWLIQLTPRWGAWLSTLLFVVWHPLQALAIGPPWADIFLHPTFWGAMLVLGVILAHVRIVSRSLWPTILIHWFAVLIWKSLLGGPFY